MKISPDPERDLSISRVIKAPRSAVWRAWADPRQFAKWWVPAPEICKIVEMDLSPGGAFKTQISQNGKDFSPHLDACFLAVDPMERIVFTNALTGGWRPAESPFITAIITLADHENGTNYDAYVMHKSPEDRKMHDELGFFDGWGTVIGQLARMVEQHS